MELIETLLEGLGEWLTYIRITKNISQKDLAKKLGCRQGTVSEREAERYANVALKDIIKTVRVLIELGQS